MFINEDMIVVFFRLLNFTALVGLAAFLFKKHIMPDVQHTITKEKNDRDALFTERAVLEKKQFALENLLKEESLLCEQFKSKVDEWKKVVELESEFREREHQRNATLLAARAAQRNLQKEHTLTQTAVINTVIPELQESLSHFFTDQEESEKFLNSIVRFMDEKKS